MPVQSTTSAKHVSGALAKASRRVLGHEERLAKVSTSILRTAGLAAAKRFEKQAKASLVAAAGDGGWTPPHENELIDVEAVIAALRGKSDPIRRSAIEDYGSTLKRLAPELDWDVTNPLVGGVLAGAAQHVRGIADTTRVNLMRIIRRSYEEGLSIEDTGKAIRAGMTEASKVRGRLIARTEMAAVTNGGSLAATKLLVANGVGPYFKRWMTAPGAHYPRHEDYDGLDGQTVALDDAFDVGGSALQFPGDPDGPPEEICNCRCTLAYVESQDEPLPGEPEPPPEMPSADEGDIALEPIDGDTSEELAGVISSNAEAMEPYVTEALQAATEPFAGHLQGFEYRFKTEASIARKIESDIGVRLAGLPAPIAATAIKDALRYTVLYRPGEYVDKMTKTLDALKAAGIEAERVRAYWAKGSDYAGTNAIMRTPNGYRFELQFHTPQSYNVKEFVNHDSYEIWRKIPDRSSPEALALSRKMSAAADEVRRPRGIEDWSYDGSVHGDVGITPFREGVDDPVGFYDSEKFARFQKDARELADYYGVTLDEQARATGVWESAEEPSVHLQVHDGEKGVRAFAAALGRAYRQDGVAIFAADNGDAVIARFAGDLDPAKVYEAMERAELPAGRFVEAPARARVLTSVPEDFEENVFGWPGEAEDVGGAAVTEAQTGVGDLYVLDDAAGIPQAVANVERGGDSLVVHNIASSGGGEGTALLREIAAAAAKDDLGVRLVATPDAVSYYKHLGLTVAGDRSVHLTAAAAREFGKRGQVFEVIGSGPEFVAQLNALSRDLGVEYDGYVGHFDLLEAAAGDYEKAIADAQGARAVAAGKAGRGAAGLPGGAPLEGGAQGAQVRAALGGRELPSSALDDGWKLSHSEEAFPSAEAPPGFDDVQLDRLVGSFDAFQQDVRGGNFGVRDLHMRREVDRLIEANPLGEDVIAIGGDPEFSDLFDIEPGALPTVGAETFEAGYGDVYLSTSVARSAAGSGSDSGFLVFHLPKGTPAVYVDHFVMGAREGQILLPRDQTLRVIGIDEKRLFGKPVVHVELTDYPISMEVPPAPPPSSLGRPSEISPPQRAPGFPGSTRDTVVGNVTEGMADKMSVDELWGEHAGIGQSKNAARAEFLSTSDDALVARLWERGEGELPEGGIRFSDISGDQQAHSVFSDGHNTVQQVAAEAQARGEHRIVISDHAHALTSADILKQHEMIDAYNADYQKRGIDFKIEKGIEANILADGSLDVAPEILAQFDYVNAAIHGPIEGYAGQLTLFKEANTTRLLRALDNPELDVLVHPHSVAADWDAVAAKAAQKGVALEVNGRDLLRNSRQEAAADMIDAAKRHGAKLVVGSDAHTTADLVDVLYAVRFASTHGVTPQDLAPIARVDRLGVDPSTSFPGSLNASGEGAHRLGGGMNEVWKIETEDGRQFVVKPDPDLDVFRARGIDTENPIRENIKAGNDLERERAAFVVSRLFNEVGGADYHVNVPAYRIGELVKEARPGSQAETKKAGIATFIPGQEGRSLTAGPWRDSVTDTELKPAAIFDALIGNTDRHAGNFLFGTDADGFILPETENRLWLIDHGLAFPDGVGAGYLQNTNLVDRASRVFGVFDEETGLALTPLNAEDLSFLRRLRDRLPDIYDELRDLLSPHEIDQMSERLDTMLRTKDWADAAVNERGEEPPG